LSECTVVSGDGVRVKHGFRGRTLSWEQTTSVAPRNKWRADGTLTVRVPGGEMVLHVPETLREEFVAYAERHRKQVPAPPTDDARDRPIPE
jgi:hypothetical protein